jgi:TolA-binding protein
MKEKNVYSIYEGYTISKIKKLEQQLKYATDKIYDLQERIAYQNEIINNKEKTLQDLRKILSENKLLIDFEKTQV